jgi:NAD(P)-dependent dehydrogenase (short-subunit alcohol dehydrogenase family)
MRNESSVIELFTKAQEKFGLINILIANHGIEENEDVPIWEMSLSQWNNTININLTGIFLACREYLKQLKTFLENPSCPKEDPKNLSIILIASTAAIFGEAYHADYAASKSALFGFMKSLKNEIVKIHRKLRINCVAPGWVRTPMAEKVNIYIYIFFF